MKIVFVSNYFNHHQQALSDRLYLETNGDYRFVATSVMRQERKDLGYGLEKIPEYVLNTYLDAAEKETAERWIIDADVVVIGSAPEELLKNRKKEGNLIFRYSERPLRKGLELHKYLYRLLKWHKNNPQSSDCYLLCASAYTAADYAKFGLFKDKGYRWGYYPAVRKYDDIHKLLQAKVKNSILWTGRFLDLKHPDDVIRLAKRLKNDGLTFELNMIGTGEMECQLKNMIREFDLEDCVHLLGSMKPEQVRDYMERSKIFLFTSDRNEGWGAVLNESMNSACAVVASHAIGSVPFLLRDGENGLIYESGNIEMLYEKVKFLLNNPERQKILGKQAYQTIVTEWNAEVAAKRLVELSKHILLGEKHPDLFRSGPCSKAEMVRDGFWKNR